MSVIPSAVWVLWMTWKDMLWQTLIKLAWKRDLYIRKLVTIIL